jgi:hypothetical protein
VFRQEDKLSGGLSFTERCHYVFAILSLLSHESELLKACGVSEVVSSTVKSVFAMDIKQYLKQNNLFLFYVEAYYSSYLEFQTVRLLMKTTKRRVKITSAV